MKGDRRKSREQALVQPDVDSLIRLQMRLFEVAYTADPNASPPVTPAARGDAFCLFLKGYWETLFGAQLEAVKEIEDAFSFLEKFFAPLLDSEALAQALGGSTVFRTGAPGTNLGTDPSRFSASATYADYAQSFLSDSLQTVEVALGHQFDVVAAARIENLVRGVSVVASLPMWTVYHHFHGLAAYQLVLPRAKETLEEAKRALPKVYDDLVRIPVPDPRATMLVGAPEHALVRISILLLALLVEKAQALDGLQSQVERLPARSHRNAADLNTIVHGRSFWRETNDGVVTVGLQGVDEPTSSAAQLFPYIGRFEYQGAAKLHSRSFAAVEEAWAALAQFVRLVTQAGFGLMLTAASNPHGGRHPPHTTHRSGIEFDLDWAYVAELRDEQNNIRLVRNLARMTKRYGHGIFRDVEKDRYFEMVPAPGDTTPETHTKIEYVATLVVLQAAALSGLRRYLYVDVHAMHAAPELLGMVVDPSLFARARRSRNIPVVEGLAHYNHLHAEAKDAAGGERDAQTSSSLLTTDNLTLLFNVAKERDQDARFTTLLDAPKDFTEAERKRVERFKNDWLQRSQNGAPSLLPVIPTRKIERAYWGDLFEE